MGLYHRSLVLGCCDARSGRISERLGQDAAYNTHTVLNAIPQRPKFNQGIWQNLEFLTGAWAQEYEKIWVIQGPVFYKKTTLAWIGDEGERKVAVTTKVNSGKDKSGRDRMHTVCGLLMHSSIAAATGGLPLGMAAAKFWTRKKFKGTNALRKRINPTRMPIEGKEGMRWLDNLRQSTGL